MSLLLLWKQAPKCQKMEVVTERLLHEEPKHKEDSKESSSQGLSVSRSKKGIVKCYHCGKPGHLKNCRFLSNDGGKIGRSASQPERQWADTLRVSVMHWLLNMYVRLVSSIQVGL